MKQTEFLETLQYDVKQQQRQFYHSAMSDLLESDHVVYKINISQIF